MSFTDTTFTPTEIDTKYIADAITLHGKSVRFFCGIVDLYGEEYLIYLDKSDSLTFVQFTDKSMHKTSIKSVLKKADEYYISQIAGNHLYALNNSKKTFSHYTINKDFTITQKNEISLNKANTLKGMNFRVTVDGSRFIVKDSLLFINYSVNKPKNYIDETAILYFNLNNEKPKPQFIISYPASYKRERIYLTDLLFGMTNDSCLAFGYLQHDDLGIYNIKRNTITQTNINRKAGYISFDEEKNMNLGYVNNYLQKNETNTRLIADNSQHIYLFKRLTKTKKTDKDTTICYAFTSQLAPICSFKLHEEASSYYIYKYQKGFLAFTKDLSKAYYYAFD